MKIAVKYNLASQGLYTSADYTAKTLVAAGHVGLQEFVA